MIPDIEIFMHDIVVHVVQGDISLRDVPKEWKSGVVNKYMYLIRLQICFDVGHSTALHFSLEIPLSLKLNHVI